MLWSLDWANLSANGLNRISSGRFIRWIELDQLHALCIVPLIDFFAEVTSMLWYYSYFYILRFYIHVSYFDNNDIVSEMVLNPLWWEMLISRAWNLLIRGLNPFPLISSPPQTSQIFILFGKIQFAILINIFCNVEKYCICNLDKHILKLGQIHFNKILQNCKTC